MSVYMKAKIALKIINVFFYICLLSYFMVLFVLFYLDPNIYVCVVTFNHRTYIDKQCALRNKPHHTEPSTKTVS